MHIKDKILMQFFDTRGVIDVGSQFLFRIKMLTANPTHDKSDGPNLTFAQIVGPTYDHLSTWYYSIPVEKKLKYVLSEPHHSWDPYFFRFRFWHDLS